MEASLFMSPPFSPITRTTLTTPSKLSNPTLSLLFFSKKPSVHCPKLSIIPFKTIKCSLSHRPEYIPNRISDPSYIRISDTTLRDGEQAPGACMTSKQKLDVARQLAKLGVDIIEAGFPAAAKDDLEAVKMIAKEVGNTVSEDGHVPVICAFGRCSRGDIEAAWEAVRYAKRPRISMFIATSEIHMKHKLRKTKEEIMQIAGEMVSYARSLGCDDVVFIPEDAGRSDREFLYQILGKVIEAGATTLTIADTVGYTLPSEFGQLIADIKSNTPGIDNVILSTHCHDDLGLSTANSLAGAYAGARQIEVTVNGTGERAGNAPLEEVVMAIKCRGKGLLGGLYTGINTKQIVMASKMVAEYTGLYVQPHKSIVGANAFAHASGIHQDGMVKCKDTYQIISPTDIGLPQSNEFNIVLGKLSGRRALKSRLLELGYKFDGKELDDVFVRFKAMAEKKKHISDSDIEALVTDNDFQPQIIWSLGDVHVTCGTLNVSTATVKLIGADGVEHVASSDGIDPIGTAFGAIDLIIKMPVTLLEYSVNAKTEGINAIASTQVVICEDSHNSTHALNGQTAHRTFRGAVAGKDIIVSSIQAYLSALNKMLRFKNIPALKISTERVEVTV